MPCVPLEILRFSLRIRWTSLDDTVEFELFYAIQVIRTGILIVWTTADLIAQCVVHIVVVVKYIETLSVHVAAIVDEVET